MTREQVWSQPRLGRTPGRGMRSTKRKGEAMSDSTATVNIPKDVLEPIVRQQVAAGIVSALGNPAKLIEGLVQLTFNQKVDSNGVVSRSDYENRYALVEVLARNAIREVVKQALAEWINEKTPEIRAEVEKALGRRKSAFAKALVDGLHESLRSSWSFKCNVNLKGE